MQLIEFKKRWNQIDVGGSMEKHIDFEEIVEYLTCRELTTDSVKMAQKINAHILECNQCRKMYNAIHDFYDLAFNNSLDTNLFNPVDNIKLLIKFKIENKINLMLDRLANGIYRYDYPIYVGLRDTNSDNKKSHAMVVDEENSLNVVKVDDESCIIEVDKEEWGTDTPVIFVTNNNGEIVFSGIMSEREEVFYISVPVMQTEYNVFIATEGN